MLMLPPPLNQKNFFEIFLANDTIFEKIVI